MRGSRHAENEQNARTEIDVPRPATAGIPEGPVDAPVGRYAEPFDLACKVCPEVTGMRPGSQRGLVDKSLLADPPNEASQPAQPITVEVAPQVRGSGAVAVGVVREASEDVLQVIQSADHIPSVLPVVLDRIVDNDILES